MKKLKLDELLVESFTTSAAQTQRGTVRGNASYVWEGCLTETNELSCPGSCEPATCYQGCTVGCTTGPRPTEREPSCVPTGPAPDTCCQQTC